MKEILFFSNNKGKIKEISDLLKKHSFKVLSLNNFKGKYDVQENGNSFSENAKKKSMFGFEKFNIPCISDDSGICFEALNWKPGIHSKRFLKSFKNDKDCFNYILETASRKSKLKAYFKSSISFTYKKNYHIIFEGRVDGTVSNKILGKEGFGYDPIFIPNGHTKTFGEIKENQKNKISHRSIAVNKLIGFLII